MTARAAAARHRMHIRVLATMHGGRRTLFGSLVLMLILFPLVAEGFVGRGVVVIISTVIGLSGAYAASRDRRQLAIALLLACRRSPRAGRS